MTKSEEDFIEQFARVLLVQWCAQSLSSGHVTDFNDAGGYQVARGMGDACLAHAEEKGWIGKTTPKKVLAKGFATAAAFLRR